MAVYAGYRIALILLGFGIIMVESQTANKSDTSHEPSCYLRATDELNHRRVQDMLKLNVKLIEYEISFPNLSVNPLSLNNTWSYNPQKWARVSQQHGQTLLSLAFNYGLLSLMTLTFGTEKLYIELEDVPSGCLAEQTEEVKVQEVMYLMMRDFKELDPIRSEQDQVSLVEDERVCHEILKSSSRGLAKFTDRCCQVDRITQELICSDDFVNIWLSILFTMLIAVKFGMLLFGPLLFMPGVERLSKDTIPFIVKLKTPLVKTIYICGADTPKVKFKRVLDLRQVKRFSKFKQSVDDLPIGEPVKVKLTEYHILVNYRKLLVENDVPVGITHSLIRNVFQCKMKEIEPFKGCCYTNICRSLNTEARCLWISLWKMVARVLVLFLIPTPFYLRLLVYYFYEYDEIIGRNEMLDRLGFRKTYDGSLMHYLGPTHPVFISIYVIYFATALVLGILPKKGKARFRRVLVGAFRDLKTCDWVSVVEMVVSNAIWPFKRFGIIGCVIAPIYWPIVIPITLVISIFYFLPSIYLTIRMLFYTANPGAVFGSVRTKMQKGNYRVTKREDKSLGLFEAGEFVKKVKGEDEQEVETKAYRRKVSRRIQIQRFWFHVFAAVLSIVLMYSALLILSECVGFAVEIAVFTMMGVIVNAGSVLKYTILIIMTVLYSYDCYNNVGKKYLKLNKALFGEVKGRIKDLWDVTSMPSSLQENRGFKSQELDEQGDHESPDDVAEKPPLNLMINDLVLFVDSEDMPRIPLQLFHEVCQIRVAGAPGPVYRSLIEATKEFLQIVMFLLFVFIIVMSFGAVYKVSTTNQMLATLAGGFLPFLMRTFMAPSKPDIEIGTVSFKSKLDEIIQNFYQNWPMYDFPMEKWTEEDEKAEEEKNKDKDKESGGEPDLMDRSVQTGYVDKAVQTQVPNGLQKSDLNTAASPLQGNSNNNAKKSFTDPFTMIGMEDTGSGVQEEEEEEEEVDIVIYMPREKHQGWLQEWSDIEQYGQEQEEEQPADAEELEEMEELAEEDD